MTEKSRYRAAHCILLFWTVFIGIGAVGGAACMLADPTGRLLRMDAILPYFQVLPFADVLFQDFTFSGFALLIVNGISNLTAAVLLLMHKKAGDYLGGIFGVTLMLWICIQFYMFPPNFMSTAFFIFGLCLIVFFILIRKILFFASLFLQFMNTHLQIAIVWNDR